MSMSKQEKLYRINKAYSSLRDYSTLTDVERIQIAVEETLKILEAIVKESDN